MKITERNIGLEILDGIKEIKRYKKGAIQLQVKILTDPSPAQDILKKLQLPQSSLAGLMGVSVRTIQNWKQGRRSPKGPAQSLLRIAEQHPEVFADTH